MPPPVNHQNSVWEDVLPLLDQELNGLPHRYRIPVVLCDLQGKSRKEVAGVLGWSEGTLSSRLARARALLARRLSCRGVTVSGAALAALVVTSGAAGSVPAPLLSSTTKAAMLVAAGQATTAACISLKAAALTEGMVRTMLFAKLKTTALLCGVAALGIGTGGVLYQAQANIGDANKTGSAPVQVRPKLVKAAGGGGGKRQEAQTTKLQPDDSRPQTEAAVREQAERLALLAGETEVPHDQLPSHVAERIKAFEAEADAIQKKADAEVQTLRDKLLADLQTLQEAFTKAGKLDEAVAIRGRIKELKAIRERANNLLVATKERAQNLLVNGSFEDGPETPKDGVHCIELAKNALKGWVVTRGIVAYSDHTYWCPAHGKRSLGLTWHGGDAGAAISQGFKTRKGRKYRVTFSLAGDPHGGPKEMKLQISAAGKNAQFVFDKTGNNRVDMGWERKFWEFTAEADQTTLEFLGLTHGIFGVALDDVVVVPVNE